MDAEGGDCMDNKKTGALISARRAELGLTQKQLAEQLNLSDRTISRWERGVGFPDISLLEPLANALGLSIVELVHGERCLNSEQIPLESERSVQKVVCKLGERFRQTTKRFKWLLIIISSLLILSVVILIFLLLHLTRGYTIWQDKISAQEAASICSDILITTNEFKLLNELLCLDEISSRLTDGTIYEFEDSFSAPYRGYVFVNGQPPDFFRITAVHNRLWVDYKLGLEYRILTIAVDGKTIEKCIARYEKESETVTGLDPNGEEKTIYIPAEPDYVLHNYNNTTFSRAVSQRDLFAPFSEEYS